MKYKTTRKAVVENSANIKCAGYGDLSLLLKAHQPNAYTCGIYGWNFDVYDLPGLTICTGYRNMPGTRANGISEYEQRAREIWENRVLSYDEQRAKVEEILNEFVALNGGF